MSSIRLIPRTGRIEKTNRKIIHKNYWNDSFIAPLDTEVLEDFDGYQKVYALDASENTRHEDFIFSIEPSDFPGYFGANNFLVIEFLARWDEIIFSQIFGISIETPTPNIESYQRYKYRSNANNSRNYYFKFFYGTRSNALAYITDVKLYKVSPPEYVFAT